MGTMRDDETSRGGASGTTRRGLVAGAAALVAGMLAVRTAEQVAAGADGDVVLGVVNPPQGTALSSTAINGQTQRGTFYATNSALQTPYTGAFDQNIDGVQGYTNNANNAGIAGRNDDLNGVGTAGIASNGVGIYGQSGGGAAVSASATSGYGVFSNTGSGIGVYGSTANGPYGIVGVTGRAGGVGLYGASSTGYGLLGQTAASGYSALYGVASAANTIAVQGSAIAGATAGYFNGAVTVQGSFTVLGGPKSAAVKHPDGSLRRLYCVESPEAYFEDYGEGKIVAGRAEVEIDPDFAAVVDSGKMHIFITEYDEHQALTVKKRNAKGFTVEADAQVAAMRGKRMTDLNGGFSYRVVAKRKDVVGGRLEKVQVPQVKETPNLELPQPPQEVKVARRPGK